MWVKKETPRHDAAAAKTIFRFEVLLLSGPVSQSFVARHPEAPSRVIDMRGSHTLDDLHVTIFNAFDRYDEHMYEFQIGAKKPMDRKAVRYGLALDEADPGEKSAEATSIASLDLKIGKSFFYWFDFGDDWWHEVHLLAVNPPAEGRKRYPRIVERKGESPPQYIDWDLEDEDEDEDEDDMEDDRVVQRVERAVGAPDAQRLDEIAVLMKDFCTSHLTESYVGVCEDLLEAACGTWLPLGRGKTQSWAAGMVHAAGLINFLHDPAQKPHMKLRDIAQHFGVSPATMENKSREIREAVNMFPLDPRFCLPERMQDNPFVWLKQVAGSIVDLRTQPREVQEAALKAGLIPFMPEAPADLPLKTRKKSAKKEKSAAGKDGKKSR